MNKAFGSYYVFETLGDLELAVSVDIDDPLIVVSVTDIEQDISGRGTAKRDSNDDFSLTTGRNLAFARALWRFGRKLEKRIVQSTEIA